MSHIGPSWKQPGCTCVDLEASMRHDFEGSELPLCRVHDAAEIRRRAVDADREAAEERIRLLTDAIDEVRARDEPACSCPSTAELAWASMAGAAPGSCAAHPAAAPAGASSTLALNDDAGLKNIIRGAFGGAPMTTTNNQFDGPDAA